MSQPTPDVPVVTHRDTIAKITPWWLHGFRVLRILYVLALHIDAIGEMLIQGIRRRFPNVDSADSLAAIGRDRRIRRGRLEPDATYASRLLRYLDDHARRGGPYAMLAQLYAHYAQAPFPIDLTYLGGTNYHLDTAGVITRTTISAFVPDADPRRGRWWLFLHWPYALTADGLWSDPGVWDDGGVWDSSLPAADVTDLRLLPNEWGNGHSRGTIVLLAPGVNVQDYTTASTMIRVSVD